MVNYKSLWHITSIIKETLVTAKLSYKVLIHFYWLREQYTLE